MEVEEVIIPDVETPLVLENENDKGDNYNNTIGYSSKEVISSLCEWEEIWKEMKKQLRLAGPLVSYNLLIFSLQAVSVMVVGHLGKLGALWCFHGHFLRLSHRLHLTERNGKCIGHILLESYGAKKYKMLGIHKQRAMLVLLLSIPLSFIWANTGQILNYFGQDPEISMEAGKYARFMIPSLFAMGLLQTHMIFLQAQNHVLPMIPIAGFKSLVHVLLCWLLVFKSGLGSKGAAISISVSYWVNVILLGVYVRVSPYCKETWTGFSMEALDVDGLLSFFKLAVPSAVTLCLEVWSFEMMVLLAGLLPNPKLETSVLSISLNPSATIYMIPLGLSGAISTRVSNELGAGRPYVARLAVKVSMLMVSIEGVSAACVLILGHKFWGYLYSNQQEVVNYVGQMMVNIAISHFVDGIQSVLLGTARGCGWQKIGAIVNLGAYYLVGIPCSLVLAFVYHFGGIIAALAAQALSLLVITLCTDWDQEAKKAEDRVCACS